MSVLHRLKSLNFLKYCIALLTVRSVNCEAIRFFHFNGEVIFHKNILHTGSCLFVQSCFNLYLISATQFAGSLRGYYFQIMTIESSTLVEKFFQNQDCFFALQKKSLLEFSKSALLKLKLTYLEANVL